MMRSDLSFGKFTVTAVIFLLLLSIYSCLQLSTVSASTTPEILRGHTNAVSSIDVSQDGRLLASGSIDHTVRLWDAQTGKTIRTLNGHKTEVYEVAFSPDNQMLASSSYDGSVILWNVKSGKMLRTLTIKEWSVAIAFSTDSRQLAVGSQDRNVVIYDVRDGNILRTLETKYAVSALAFSPDGRYLAADVYAIMLWDLTTGKVIKTLEGHQSSVRDLAFSNDNRFLASASRDKTARIWNVETGKTVKILETQTPIAVNYSPKPLKWKMPVTCVAFSPDGKILAMGTGRAVHLWDVSTGNQLRTLEGHIQSVTSVIFLPDGRALASGSLDGTVRLWSI